MKYYNTMLLGAQWFSDHEILKIWMIFDGY